MENLREWVPYNEFIGDPKSTDTHLVEVVEEWRTITDYPNYEVSSFGRVKSLARWVDLVMKGTPCKQFRKERILKYRLTCWGYVTVFLTNDIGGKDKVVHRLLATAFIPNPLNKPQVNHLKGIKHKNRVYNLEWATRSENMLHAHATGLIVPPKYWLGKKASNAKMVFNTITGIFYDSAREASKTIGMRETMLSSYLRGEIKNKTNFVLA